MKTTSRKILLLTAAAFALGLAVSYASSPAVIEFFFSQQKIHAMWKDHFTNFGELVQGVDTIVVGEVVAIDEGRQVTYGDGTKALRFTNVTLRADKSAKGRLGDEITVEVTGDYLGRQEVVFAGVPAFELGETYLLFLNRQEETGLYYVVNNQGGYHLDKGRLEAADPEDELAAQLHGQKTGAALRLLQKEGLTFGGILD